MQLPISYTTLYGDAVSQQISILLPNLFTILQPPPPLSTVLVLDGELEAVVDGLGVGLELVVESPPTAFPLSPPGSGAVAPGAVEPEVVDGKIVFDVVASDAVDDVEAVALTVEPKPGILSG